MPPSTCSVAATVPTDEQLRLRLRDGDFAFALILEKGFGASLGTQPAADRSAAGQRHRGTGHRQADGGHLPRHPARGAGTRAAARDTGGRRARRRRNSQPPATITVRYAYGSAAGGEMPSAVQQSVPGWLVFGVFFVVVPLSNTFIRERQLGTLRRLRSTNLSRGTVLLGKLIPYFAGEPAAGGADAGGGQLAGAAAGRRGAAHGRFVAGAGCHRRRAEHRGAGAWRC